MHKHYFRDMSFSWFLLVSQTPSALLVWPRAVSTHPTAPTTTGASHPLPVGCSRRGHRPGLEESGESTRRRREGSTRSECVRARAIPAGLLRSGWAQLPGPQPTLGPDAPGDEQSEPGGGRPGCDPIPPVCLWPGPHVNLHGLSADRAAVGFQARPDGQPGTNHDLLILCA